MDNIQKPRLNWHARELSDYRRYAVPTLLRLKEITKTCRINMHEPDEQGIKVIISGTHLDNACGADPTYGEYCIGICKDDNPPEWFNLADLIALARLAKP